MVVLVGNPRTQSRTHTAALQAAQAIAERLGLGAPAEVVDLSVLAPELPGVVPSPAVQRALELVAGADVLVVASPTYKGTYTGLLKLFLDRLPGGALASAVALPLLVMGDPKHALAVEVHLRPLLVELGATVPTPGVALLESQLPTAEEVLGPWADRVVPQVAATLAGGVAAAR
ncbi:NADPH-dependent oxidoreductase [Actinomadura rubrisoli]|uniref:NADPH-dependent oxidoreductase n=1 Tax=Actinomadura rubrisoli TaxID=2530368 RepID=A0A4R5BMM3_9ACTN|nr:NADPH-dependent oxidoreductase [Actinomadura rubrisoli]